MTFDEGLATRLRDILREHSDVDEKKMFGGYGLMLRGNLCCGVLHDELIVRVGPDQYEGALVRSHAKKFDFTGRPMKGWILIEPEGFESDEDLSTWVQMAVDFVLSLPPK